MIASNELGRAIPEIIQLGTLLQKQILTNKSKTFYEKMKGIKLFYQGVRALLVIHDTPIYPIFLYPIVNASLFISFVFSVRGILDEDPYGALGIGGSFWFRDLVYRDETFILPCTAMICTYLLTELSFRNNVGKYAILFKDFFQCVVIIFAPITTTLQAGIFCYWIPSSIFGFCQILLMRQPSVMKFLKIPAPINRDIKLPKTEIKK